MKVFVFVVVAALLASVASAQERPSLKLPNLVYAGAASWDIGTTAYAVHHGAHEDNPAIGWVQKQHGPNALIGVAIASDVAVMYGLNKFVAPRKPRLARALLYGIAGARFYFAAQNTRKIVDYHRELSR